MGYFILIAGVGCIWAMLRVLGGERERQLQLAQIQTAVKPASPAVPVARSATFKTPSGPIPSAPSAKPATTAPAPTAAKAGR